MRHGLYKVTAHELTLDRFRLRYPDRLRSKLFRQALAELITLAEQDPLIVERFVDGSVILTKDRR